jgi:hypothetical protein
MALSPETKELGNWLEENEDNLEIPRIVIETVSDAFYTRMSEDHKHMKYMLPEGGPQ